MSSRKYSIVQWFPELEKHKCGYCKQLNTNCSYGMWAESLNVEDYQQLIDRGWRRSGKYCYKPVMDITCCPLYTIRCEALNFKVSKSQKKIIKRVNRFLSTDAVDEKLQDEIATHPDNMNMDSVQHQKPVHIDLEKIDADQINLAFNRTEDALQIDEEILTTSGNSEVKPSSSFSNKSEEKYKPGLGADPNKPPCKKAKLIRLERKQQKLAAKGITLPQQTDTSALQAKSIDDFIEEICNTPAHKLKVCLVLTGTNNQDWTQVKLQEYSVYKKYQMTIHGDSADKCSEKQFTNFLLESPLQHVTSPDGPESGYGSFHQQYWLDEKLIAVGVIDILPKCVSSVYFFYDPDYRHLSLGTYGSLRELYFVRQLQKTAPALKYYYMGFYIHSCPKMKYKANLTPSYLLCPETYIWFPIEQCIRKLERTKYCRFNADKNKIDEDGCYSMNDVSNLVIIVDYKSCVPFKFLRPQINEAHAEDYFRLGYLIGKKLINKILVMPKNLNP